MPSAPAPAKKFSQVALGVLHVVRATGAARRIAQSLEPGVEAAFADPRRHRRVEPGRRRFVGVHVGGDVDASGARRLDAMHGVVELAPALLARLLEVVDLDGDAGAPADLDHLVDGRAQPHALVAHVGGVEPALARGDLGERHQLVGAEGFVGRVDERRGQAERAFVHRLRHHGAHALQLERRRAGAPCPTSTAPRAVEVATRPATLTAMPPVGERLHLLARTDAARSRP